MDHLQSNLRKEASSDDKFRCKNYNKTRFNHNISQIFTPNWSNYLSSGSCKGTISVASDNQNLILIE